MYFTVQEQKPINAAFHTIAIPTEWDVQGTINGATDMYMKPKDYTLRNHCSSISLGSFLHQFAD